MSGRIRSVKPEWLEDELLALASDAARVLTIGLMLQADDYGNGRANPILLAGQVFPGKVLEHTANALEELRNIRFVTLYEVDGQRYFHIRNWDKHQRVDKPGKPRVPGPPEVSSAFAATSGHVAPPSAPTPETPEKVPETPTNLLASRGSDRGPDRVVGPVPDPGQPRDLKAMAEHMLRDRCGAELVLPPFQTWPEVTAIGEAFAETWGRRDDPRHGGDPRAKAILLRFAEGYTADQLALAVRRSKFADYMLEKRSNQALVTILRDAAQVDKFSALTQPSSEPTRRGHGRPAAASDDERARARNNLLDDAKAGRFGAKAKARAESGHDLGKLVDDLETWQRQRQDKQLAAQTSSLLEGIGR
jgi:hypothetical protein